MARIHKDVEFAVDDQSGTARVFHDLATAQAFAMSIVMQSGGATLVDPEASVFEFIEVDE